MSPHRTPGGYGWASRFLAAAVVTVLLTAVALFFQVRDLQQQITDGRRDRSTFQRDTTAKLCALLQTQPGVDRARYAELCS